MSSTILLSDTACGGAAVATGGLLAGLLKHAENAEWWHFGALPGASGGLPAVSLDPRLKRPPVERAIKNVSLPFANRMRAKRHQEIFLTKLAVDPPKLVNCHNIHSCGLNHDTLRENLTGVPIVWTMHDCWSFQPKAFEWLNEQTGKSETVCADLDEAASWKRRRRFFEERPDVVLVAPSRWILGEARKRLPQIRIEHIPYAVCPQKFRPGDREEARRKLNLDPQKIWLGAGATHAYSRKGLDILAAAFHLIDTREIGLLSWGQKPALDWPADLEVRAVGSISESEKLAELYSACDIFLCPSRCDNLPNAVLESLACGVPVIGSTAGGIPDMVREGKTGWLFRSDNIGECAAAITKAIADRPSWDRMKRECREIAETEYHPDLQADRYVRLFSEIGNL